MRKNEGTAMIRQREFYTLQTSHSCESGELKNASFPLSSDYLHRKRITSHARLLLLCGIVVGIPLIGIWSFMTTQTQVPLWLKGSTVICCLIAAKLYVSQCKFLRELSRLSESKNGPGLKVNTDGFYFSVATLGCQNIKRLVQNGKAGNLLKWDEIVDIRTEHMHTPNGNSWFLVVKTKLGRHPYLIKFDAIAASQNEILDALRSFRHLKIQ